MRRNLNQKNCPHLKTFLERLSNDLSVNNSDKVRISLHNSGLSSPVVQETQNGSSNGVKTPNYNGSSSLTGGHNGGQAPINGGDPACNGDQPGTGGGGQPGSGAQRMSAPRRGRGVLQQQEPGMRVPVCGATGEPIRCWSEECQLIIRLEWL